MPLRGWHGRPLQLSGKFGPIWCSLICRSKNVSVKTTVHATSEIRPPIDLRRSEGRPWQRDALVAHWFSNTSVTAESQELRINGSPQQSDTSAEGDGWDVCPLVSSQLPRGRRWKPPLDAAPHQECTGVRFSLFPMLYSDALTIRKSGRRQSDLRGSSRPADEDGEPTDDRPSGRLPVRSFDQAVEPRRGQ